MSYCRCGEDSDVYVLNTWNGIEVHVGHMPRPKKLGMAGDYFEYKTNGWCLRKLLKLREQGLKIPERALDRLREQISGEWYTKFNLENENE